MFGGWLGDGSVFMCPYTMHIYGQTVATCVHICALNVCTCCVVSQSASLLRRAVGGKRAA